MDDPAYESFDQALRFISLARDMCKGIGAVALIDRSEFLSGLHLRRIDMERASDESPSVHGGQVIPAAGLQALVVGGVGYICAMRNLSWAFARWCRCCGCLWAWLGCLTLLDAATHDRGVHARL